MNIVCLDMEGVLVPEIWIAFAEESGIPELRRTTRDEPDYDKLMRWRIDILRQHGLGLTDIQNTIRRIDPLPGAREFLDRLRTRTQVVILSDTFEQFGLPLMEKLNWPTLLCNTLEVGEDGMISGFRMRCSHSKLTTVRAFQSMGYDTIAAGDSYNDLDMIRASKAGFLFRSHSFVQICDDVSFYLKFTGIERNTASRLWPYASRVVNVISFKRSPFNLFHCKISCKLVHHNADHFKMVKFFCCYVSKQGRYLPVGH